MINPAIVLGGRPVQVADPAEQYAKALSLQQMHQQMQAQAESIKHAQMQTAAAERDAREYDDFKSGLRSGAKLSDLIATSPKLGQAYAKSQSDQKTAELAQAKTRSEIYAAHAARLGSLSGAAVDQPSYEYAIHQAVKEELLTPEQAAQLPAQYDPAVVKQFTQQALSAKDKHELDIKDIEAQQKTAKFNAELPGVVADSERKVTESAQVEQYGMSKKDFEDLQRKGLPNTPAELAIIASDPNEPADKRKSAQDALKILERHAIASRPVTNVNAAIPGVSTQPTKLTGEDYLNTLPPAFSARVKAIAEGRDGIPTGRAATQGAGLQLSNAVYQYDPSFSVQRAQVRKAFTTGPDGRNVGALNTAIVHLSRLGDAAEALKNGDLTPQNELYNWVKDKFGAAAVSNFELLKDAVAGEMAAALKGNATDVEIANMKKSIRASNSPAQMRGVVTEGMKVLSDKARTFEERYQREMPGDTWSPLLPSAKSALERYGQGSAKATEASPLSVVEWERGPDGRPRPKARTNAQAH